MSKKQKKVLIVEDEKPMAHALELKLTKVGYLPVVCHDGESALKILQQEKFDLILLDLMMPKLDGFGVMEQLKSQNSKISIIVTSNLGQEEDSRRAKELGALEYIIKSDTPIGEIV